MSQKLTHRELSEKFIKDMREAKGCHPIETSNWPREKLQQEVLKMIDIAGSIPPKRRRDGTIDCGELPDKDTYLDINPYTVADPLARARIVFAQWLTDEYTDEAELQKYSQMLLDRLYEEGLAIVATSSLTPALGAVFTHDCDHCKFLGHFFGHDTYICEAKGKASGVASIIARFGNDGPEYASTAVTHLHNLLMTNCPISGEGIPNGSMPYREFMLSEHAGPANRAWMLGLAIYGMEGDQP